jgi:hypothetical protein
MLGAALEEALEAGAGHVEYEGKLFTVEQAAVMAERAMDMADELSL